MNWERGDELRADPGEARADNKIAGRKRRPVWSFLAVVLVAAAFFGVIFYAYRENGDFGHSGPPPLIKADAGPTKIRPDQPGGQEIPFQNSTVYDRLSSGGQKPQVEKLLPPPETPVERAAAPPPAATPAPDVTLAPPTSTVTPPAPTPGGALPALPPLQTPVATSTPAPALPAAAKAPVAAAPPPRISSDQFNSLQQGALQQGATPEKAKPAEKATDSPTALAPKGTLVAPPAVVASAASPAPKPAAPKLAEPKPAAIAPPAAPPANASGVYRIQVGSVRSEGEVAAEWARIRERFPQTLSTLKVSTQKVDLAGKGPFYRIQAGPLDAVKAKAACDRLQAQGAGCIVLKP